MEADRCEGALEVVVPPGEMEEPSGLALWAGPTGEFLYATDHGTGEVKAFAKSGELVNWLDTGLGAGRLTGVAISREGAAYVLDAAGDRLYRIDPR